MNRQSSKKTKIVAIMSILVVLAIVVLLLLLLNRPERSVSAFCNTYKEQNDELSNSTGSTYSLKPFTHSTNNPKDFVNALSKLEAVSPNEIQPDVKTIKQIYEKIDQDPSQALSASLSGLGAEENLAKWTSSKCQ